jgi:hypothetical protein
MQRMRETSAQRMEQILSDSNPIQTTYTGRETSNEAPPRNWNKHSDSEAESKKQTRPRNLIIKQLLASKLDA